MFFHWIFAFVLCIAVSTSVCFGALNAKDYGATGLGEVDDSAAIQKALDEAEEKGGMTVKLPAGKYRMDNPITIPSGVTLAGEWESPHHAQLEKGTVIHVYAGKDKPDDPPLIKLSPSSTVRGLTIFYPEQRIPEIHQYPWTIQGEGMHCSVIDMTLVNPYKAIDFGTHWNELHYIRNVFGCPLRTGVYIDQCSDIGRIENVHFNPHYWIRAEVEENKPSWPEIFEWLFNNTTAFEIGRSDWEYMINTFSFGCKVGIRFFASEHGPANGNFLGVGIDWANTAVLVEQTWEYGVLFTNAQFVGGEGSESHIEVAESHNGVVQFTNSSFWGPSERIARIYGDGMISFSNCNFVWWDLGDKGAPAIEAHGGDVSVMGSRFRRDLNQIVLGPDVKTAVISANTMVGPIKIENNSTGDVQIFGNVSRANVKKEDE